MELKIKDMRSLNMLVEALTLNGYELQTKAIRKKFPESGTDYFSLKVEECTEQTNYGVRSAYKGGVNYKVGKVQQEANATNDVVDSEFSTF